MPTIFPRHSFDIFSHDLYLFKGRQYVYHKEWKNYIIDAYNKFDHWMKIHRSYFNFTESNLKIHSSNINKLHPMSESEIYILTALMVLFINGLGSSLTIQ